MVAAAGADYLKIDRRCSRTRRLLRLWQGRDGLNATGRPVYVSLCGWNTWPPRSAPRSVTRASRATAPTGARSPTASTRTRRWASTPRRAAGTTRTSSKARAWAPTTRRPTRRLLRQGGHSAGQGWCAPPRSPPGVSARGRRVRSPAARALTARPPARAPPTRYQSEAQSRAQFTMWAVMAAPLLISADVGQVRSPLRPDTIARRRSAHHTCAPAPPRRPTSAGRADARGLA